MKRIFCLFMIAFLLMGLTGCGGTQDNETEKSSITAATGASADAGEENASADTEEGNDSADAGEENNSDYVAGKGFRPPAGSRLDRNGNVVDPEGNTYDKEGKWQVPEGGWVDSQGRIHDKSGKLMGGGATIGSQG